MGNHTAGQGELQDREHANHSSLQATNVSINAADTGEKTYWICGK
jgi:hypothetical protein